MALERQGYSTHGLGEEQPPGIRYSFAHMREWWSLILVDRLPRCSIQGWICQNKIHLSGFSETRPRVCLGPHLLYRQNHNQLDVWLVQERKILLCIPRRCSTWDGYYCIKLRFCPKWMVVETMDASGTFSTCRTSLLLTKWTTNWLKMWAQQANLPYNWYHLKGVNRPSEASISRRMSWVSCRKTTRTEDLAYCLLRIFEKLICLCSLERAVTPSWGSKMRSWSNQTTTLCLPGAMMMTNSKTHMSLFFTPVCQGTCCF